MILVTCHLQFDDNGCKWVYSEAFPCIWAVKGSASFNMTFGYININLTLAI